MKSNESVRNRKKNISFYKLLKHEARVFCTETGLHGFKYIVMKNTNSTERFTWTFISFGALCFALTLSMMSWNDSMETPVITATDTMDHPISKFFFPAVSICNLNKISKRKAFHFAKERLDVKNATEWQLKLRLLAQMYFANYVSIDSKSYEKLQGLLDAVNITAEDALNEITPSCNDLLQNCIWKERKIRCQRVFQKTRTPEGICCTFNYYALKNQVFSGYMSERNKPFPRKATACGPNSGVKVLINNEPDDYLVSELSAVGVKVVIHDTYNFPDWSAQRVLIPTVSEVYVDINPSMVYGTNALRSMNVKKRGCVFKDERTLTIFSNYSYENCLTECRINILRKVCGCMPFYYRNEWVDWKDPIRVCNLRDIMCLSTNKPRFMSSVPGYDAYLTKSSGHVWGTEKSECKCLPDCESRTYIVYSTKGQLSQKDSTNNQQLYQTVKPLKHKSAVSIFYKGLSGVRMKRDMSLVNGEIIGLFGGLLGLCLGFTIISVIELIYTFTVRLCLDYYNQKNENLKISDVNQKLFTVRPLHSKPWNFEDAPNETVFLH